jgi:excisionase family DNA binding protein
MHQFLSLEKAAHKLGVSVEKLKEMAERHEIKMFRDRGDMLFRAQEVEELSRRLGRGSDPELPIVDLPPTRSPVPGAKGKGEVFDFALGGDESENVEIGRDPTASGSGSKSKGSGRSGRTPTPKPGSDSDVRLVSDGSDLDFQVADDSRLRLEEAGKSGSGRSKKEKKSDSDVRIVPPDVQSDSDIKIVEPPIDSKIVLGREGVKKASDSDIRLEPEKAGSRKHGDDLVTEEIDLDAELREGESSLQAKSKPSKSGIRGKTGPMDVTAPFELSDPKLTKVPKSGKLKKDSSSDFELTPGGGSPLEVSDEEVQLGELTGKPGGSGINLQDPADSGISLEQGGSGEAVEFELSKSDSSSGSGPRTPTRKHPLVEDDSDSEFEISLDPSASPSKKKKTKAKPKAEVDSDSEFELTLDDSGDLLPIEGEVASKSEEEADIFETDFEVPALDEDSGSEAVALDESDTDVESSDFDLALGEEDVASEEESGSQVVALEEEEAEPGASTVARAGRGKKGLLAEEDEGLLAEDELEGEPQELAVAAAPAAWGPLPAIIMIPCVIVMFLVTLISFEQIQSMWGYHNNQKVSSTLSRSLANLFSLDVKD